MNLASISENQDIEKRIAITPEIAKKIIDLKNYDVVGIDNLNSYYSKNLKIDRLKEVENNREKLISKWTFIEQDISDNKIEKIFQKYNFKIVINLAAQAGVRYSIQNPKAYINSNIVGFHNILECCKNFGIENLLYASSSSV